MIFVDSQDVNSCSHNCQLVKLYSGQTDLGPVGRVGTEARHGSCSVIGVELLTCKERKS